MDTEDFYELSVEQEEYLVELLCTRGACAFDMMARELDELCRAADYCSTSPSSGRRLRVEQLFVAQIDRRTAAGSCRCSASRWCGDGRCTRSARCRRRCWRWRAGRWNGAFVIAFTGRIVGGRGAAALPAAACNRLAQLARRPTAQSAPASECHRASDRTC